MKKSETKVIIMTKGKETKRTVVYEATGLVPVRTQYVEKGTWDPMPEKMRVTIEPLA